MTLEVTTGRPVILRRLHIDDIEDVVALVESKIAEDESSGREPRLGPVSAARLRESFEEYGGLSLVLSDESSGSLFGCALVLAFEPLEAQAKPGPRLAGAEAAKLTVIDPLLGTDGASLLHALRIVGAALQDPLGGPLTLYYNVLGGNGRQLEYMSAWAFEEIQPTGPLAGILDQRRGTIDLHGQHIRTFIPSAGTVKIAVGTVLDGAVDRMLSRADRNAAEPHLRAWELKLDHPVFNEELPILLEFAAEIGVRAPRQLKRR
jgi:hypothetical protein